MTQYSLMLVPGQKRVNYYSNKCLNIYVLQLMPLYISLTKHQNLLKSHTQTFLHVSVYDHHQGALT